MLKVIFEKEPDFEVVGHARDGREAVGMAAELRPDLITMDIRMPEMDGFEATRVIMSTRPIPIVVISSSVDDEEMRTTFRAIEEGALAVIEKPKSVLQKDFDRIGRDLVTTIRAMSEVKLVRRIARWSPPQGAPPRHDAPPRHGAPLRHGASDYELISIGASTGGPQALQVMLSEMPMGLNVPMVVVQHMSRGFISGMCEWLRLNTMLNVKMAENGERLLPDTVYFAPEDLHLTLRRIDKGLVAYLVQGNASDFFCPAVDALFKSAASVCGKRGIGVLLSGMGTDGAGGLLEMRRSGGHTIIQDEKSSVVFGMPGAALAMDAVDKIVDIDKMSSYLSGVIIRQHSFV